MSDNPDYQGLLRSILIDPSDDIPRLVLADWLDEHSMPERAQFIRCQIEIHRRRNLYCDNCETPQDVPGKWKARCRGEVCTLRRREWKLWAHNGAEWCRESFAKPMKDWQAENTRRMAAGEIMRHPEDDSNLWIFAYRPERWERGFMREIHLPIRAFVGGSCGRCQTPYGSGTVITGRNGGTLETCPVCLGTGNIGNGYAKYLFERLPLISVRLTDRKPRSGAIDLTPIFSRSPRGQLGSEWHRQESSSLDSAQIVPDILFDLIDLPFQFPRIKMAQNSIVALDALGIASVKLGRSLAKLDSLPTHSELVGHEENVVVR